MPNYMHIWLFFLVFRLFWENMTQTFLFSNFTLFLLPHLPFHSLVDYKVLHHTLTLTYSWFQLIIIVTTLCATANRCGKYKCASPETDRGFQTWSFNTALGSEADVYLWCGRRREGWSGFNASVLHERQQLVRYLGQYIFGQSGHAEHLVPGSVDVVPERHKLEKYNLEMSFLIELNNLK